MRVSVALNHHFLRTPDGAVWTLDMFAYPFWSRYLDVYSEVRVVARVRDVAEVPAVWHQADGPQVAFEAMPDFVGPSEYVRRRGQLRRALRRLEIGEEAVILRTPSVISTGLWRKLLCTGHPYAVEVCGDPWDGLSPGSFHHPLLPAFRWAYTRDQRRQCARATAALYVTREALQRRYPNRAATITGAAHPQQQVGISDAELHGEAFASQPRVFTAKDEPVRLVMVGSIDHLKKAPDMLVEAVAAAVKQGSNVTLRFVGGGRYQEQLANTAAERGIAERVEFAGHTAAGAAVRRELDQADVFVLPSRHEGLPRAMLEAMARGLPCIASTAGGMGELVPEEDLVTPGDVAGLAAKIREVTSDPQRMTAMAARNLTTARQYADHRLQAQRIEFYEYLRDQTREWLAPRLQASGYRKA